MVCFELSQIFIWGNKRISIKKSFTHKGLYNEYFFAHFEIYLALIVRSSIAQIIKKSLYQLNDIGSKYFYLLYPI